MLHDLKVFLWGVMSRHPNVRETRLAILWPITFRFERYQLHARLTTYFRVPKILWLNSYELETDFNQLHFPGTETPAAQPFTWPE
jgi:hypothetical protein